MSDSRLGKTRLRLLAEEAGKELGLGWTVVRRPGGYALEEDADKSSVLLVCEGATASEMAYFLRGVLLAISRERA